jgi:hypothetical protein
MTVIPFNEPLSYPIHIASIVEKNWTISQLWYQPKQNGLNLPQDTFCRI